MSPARQNELDALIADTMAFVESVKDGQMQPEPVIEDGVADTMAVANTTKEQPDRIERVDAVVAVLHQALADKSPKPFLPMTWPLHQGARKLRSG